MGKSFGGTQQSYEILTLKRRRVILDPSLFFKGWGCVADDI
jgi:hypothetical protein